MASIRGYQLRERLGEGAFGTVYRAFQPSVQRDVAVKVIKPELVDNPEFIRRFEIEAQLVARLEHLHIVPLHDYWRDADGAYLVMRLLGGGNLKDALSDGSFTVAQTVKVAQEIGGALAAAHSSGVVHRDIKPANVLLDDAGNTYLSDFGIAKDLGSDAAVTRSGQALGSPAYMAPEQLRSEPPSPQTDIYALGLLVYEMLAGSHPFDIDSLVRLIDDQMTAPLPALEGEVEGVPTGIDEVLGRATAKPPLQRFPDVSTFLDALSAVVGSEAGAEVMVPLSAPNPFKGLRAFQESDAADFFGRTELIDRFVGRLDGERFLAVVGPSGSGKSSVVRAGLVPALRRGAIAGSESWLVADFIPGLRPFEELEAALLRVAVNPPSTLLEQLQRDEGGLRSAIKRILPPGTELLLVIDQFEEVFTLTDDATRDLFVANLLGAIGDERTPIRLVVTLRADFYDRPLQFEEFGELMRTRTETVLPLGRAGIEEAVTGPASRVGVPVDPDLVPEIAADLADEPGALPLLQYALTQVFDARRGGNLSVETYRDVGGVSGALAKRAEELYAGLDEDNRAATRQVFLQLVTLGEGTGDTRRRVPVPDLEALGTVRDILSVYGDARLLSFDRDPTTRTPTVEVAHEALLTEWNRLRAWIDDGRDDLRVSRRLAGTTTEWEDSGWDPSFLLTGSRLTNLREWAETTSLTIGPGEQALLDASIQRATEEEHAEAARAAQEAVLEHRSRRRLRILVAVMATAAIIGVALTVFAFTQRSKAQDQARIAAEQTDIAEQQARIAADQTAEAEAQAGIAEEQTAEAETQANEAEAQRSEAQRQQTIAEREASTALTRELIAQSAANRSTDPQLALLLALASTASDRHIDGAPLPEAVSALSDATQAIKISQAIVSVDTGDQKLNVLSSTPLLSDGPSAPLWNTLGSFGFNFFGAFSPDGKLLAIAEKEGVVRVWDTQSGLPVGSLAVDGDRVTAMTFNPDGSILAVAGSTIGLVDTLTMAPLATLEPTIPTESVHTIDFSFDGSRLVAATGVAAEVFEVATGQAIGEPCCPGPIDAAFYIGETDLIATAGSANSALFAPALVTIWDPDRAAEEYRTGLGNILYAVSTDGTRIVTVINNSEFTIVDVLRDENILSVSPSGPGLAEIADAILYSPELDRIITVRAGVGQTVFDVDTERALASFPTTHPHPFPSFDATLQKAALSYTVEGRVRVIDIRNGVDVVQVPASFDRIGIRVGSPPSNWYHATSGLFLDTGNFRTEAYFDPTGSLLVSCCTGTQATLWDLDGGRGGEIGGVRLEAAIADVAVRPDGGLFVGSAGGAATVYPASGGTPVFELDGHDGAVLAVAATEERLATSDGSVTVWTADGQRLVELPGLSSVTDIAWHPDGRRLATAEERQLSIWDTDSADEPMVDFSIGNDVRAIEFSADGSLLLTTGTGGVVEGWSVTDGTPQLLIFLGFNRNVGALDVSPTGQLVATVNNDGTVLVLDLTTGEVTAEAVVHLFDGTAIAYSPDGTLLATGSLDGTVAILDAETLEERFRITLDAAVVAVAFSPDGSEFVVGDAGGRVGVYPATFTGLLDRAQTLVTRELTADECLRYLREGCPE